MGKLGKSGNYFILLVKAFSAANVLHRLKASSEIFIFKNRLYYQKSYHINLLIEIIKQVHT